MKYIALKDICDVRDGTHDSPKYVREGFPLVTSKNIVNGKLDLSTVNYLTKEDYDKINERSKVDEGDIIMPMIGTIGNPLLIGDFCEFAIKNVALIKFPNKNISNRYIWYFLRSEAFRKYAAEKNKGGTQKFLSLGDIRNMKVPQIEYSEQLSIVEKFDSICKIIAARQQELQKLDELVKARFVEMFGNGKYEEKALSELTDIITKGTTPTTAGYSFLDEGVNFFKIESINDDHSINLGKVAHVGMDCHNAFKRSQLKEGDILFSIAGAIGRTAIIQEIDLPGNTNQALAIIRLSKECGMSQRFLISALESPLVVEQYNKKKRGIAQINLSLQDIGNLRVIVPPIEEQERFAEFCNQLDKSKAVAEKALAEAQLLFDSLMQRYFG